MMKREKSCGAIVYRRVETGIELLLLKHQNGEHWSFPKGHVEFGETETQTALREVLEETGLDVELHKGFRRCVEYQPRPDIVKTVVYFLAYPKNDRLQKQESEISELGWCPIEVAEQKVTFENDQYLIRYAIKFLASDIGGDSNNALV